MIRAPFEVRLNEKSTNLAELAIIFDIPTAIACKSTFHMKHKEIFH